MLSYRTMFHRSLITGLTIVLLGTALPISVAADDPAPCLPPSNSQPGVHQPVGADAPTFTYNCATGLWENDHFTYDPSTGLETAKDPTVYSYNASSGQYDYGYWVYNAPTSSFVFINQSTATPPAGATVVGGPAPVTQNPSSTNADPTSNTGLNNNADITNTGPDSTNQLNGMAGVSANNTTQNNTLTATLSNYLNGQANTGNAMVLGNTTAGNATSGDAQAIANIVNMLQSTSSALGGDTVTFVSNINGDVNGDLMIDPGMLSTVQPATSNPTTQNNLTLNNTVNSAINNDINLSAASGSAAVGSNTNAGNATTGSAQAIANVVNLINSAISSGKSFLGIVNINGNLNGDILLPPDFLNQLIAANVPTVTLAVPSGGSNTTINNTNNLGISNAVHAGATTGNASVTGNTTAGSATSGTATTGITAFNLTGSNVIGTNDLLVFVNVLGKWVGMIVNAPPGTTAAALGGGITTNTVADNTTVNNSSQQQINNTITANSRSGDATVTNNTKAGNATTGDAKTAVNILNIENSNLSLSGWFGILFINVFGNWNGSFGMNTAAGDPVANPYSTPSGSAGSSQTTSTPAHFAVFRFVPRASAAASSSASSTADPTANSVLAANIKKAATLPGLTNPARHPNFLLPIGLGVLFVLFVVSDRVYAAFSARRS